MFDLHCKVIRLPNGQYTSKKRYGQVKIMVFGNALAVLIVSRTNLPILIKGLNSNIAIMINAHQSKWDNPYNLRQFRIIKIEAKCPSIILVCITIVTVIFAHKWVLLVRPCKDMGFYHKSHAAGVISKQQQTSCQKRPSRHYSAKSARSQVFLPLTPVISVLHKSVGCPPASVFLKFHLIFGKTVRFLWIWKCQQVFELMAFLNVNFGIYPASKFGYLDA